MRGVKTLALIAIGEEKMNDVINLDKFSYNHEKGKGNVPTWRDIRDQLNSMSDDQLDCHCTVELDLSDECVPGYVDICGPNHDSLEENHPVIRIEW